MTIVRCEPDPRKFNKKAKLPFGLRLRDFEMAMQDVYDFFFDVNRGLVERDLAAHPSLKPQAFLRTLIRGVLPLGEGVVLDPFAGSGSTLAAAEAVGYRSIGVEKDPRYFKLAQKAIPRLARYKNGTG